MTPTPEETARAVLQAWWAKPPDGQVFATAMLADAIRNAKERGDKPWKEAIIDAAVVNWTYVKEHDTDPKAAINALLCRAERMALDPAISKEAADLVERGRLAALEHAATIADGFAAASIGRTASRVAEMIRAAAKGETS